MAASPLDYKTALCFVPPREIWDKPIQEIRCFSDKAFVRWPPHINLLFPFWQDSGDNFKGAAEKVRAALEPFSPFKVTFKQLQFFDHGNTCTVWLEPESETLLELQAALVRAFPECYHLNDDPMRDIERYTPHLSIGQWPNRYLAEQAIPKLSLQLSPMEVTFDNVMILHRRAVQTPFEFRQRIPLGSNDDKEITEVNTSYVATLGATKSDYEKYPYGLGSYAQGVWNFAYGSNLSEEKLVGSRNIKPLESLPGLLSGYKLSFNHQGGMGNVERMTQASRSYFEARGIHGVHGVLYRLSYTDFARLTNMESGYRPVEVNVEASDGRGTIRAVVFISPRNRTIRDGMATTDRYIRLILEGARQWNLNKNYIQWLESVETIPPKNRGPLYWVTPEGDRIPDRVYRVAIDPPPRRMNNQNTAPERERLGGVA